MRFENSTAPINGYYRAGTDHRKDGMAAGWYQQGDFILNKLSADLPLQTEDDTQSGNGAADLRERVAP